MPHPRDEGAETEAAAEEDAQSSESQEDIPSASEQSGRFARFRRKILDRKELGEDARYLLGTVWETSDRAKSEMVKMVGREVRNYLSALRLKEDLLGLLTSHSLEINASFHLKPLDAKAEGEKGAGERGGEEGAAEDRPEEEEG